MKLHAAAKPLPQLASSRRPSMKKAIILSAGQGSRLCHLTDDKPKCLIEFNGRTLLDRQLDALAANGVRAKPDEQAADQSLDKARVERRVPPQQPEEQRPVAGPFFTPL